MKKLALVAALIVGVGFTAPLFAGGVGNLCDDKFIFKMNIIGTKAKNPPMNNISRKTIFVGLGSTGSISRTDIYLTQGAFAVCDGNGFDTARDCNGNPITNSGSTKIGAVFQLPCNLNIQADFACDGGAEACYDIYFRALGTPGGGVTITTCGLLADGTRVCSSENTGLISRNTGTPKFTRVTNELSSLVGCVTVSGVQQCGRYALFRNEFEDFLWQYDNQGLRNGQMIFCGADCGS